MKITSRSKGMGGSKSINQLRKLSIITYVTKMKKVTVYDFVKISDVLSRPPLTFKNRVKNFEYKQNWVKNIDPKHFHHKHIEISGIDPKYLHYKQIDLFSTDSKYFGYKYIDISQDIPKHF